MVLKVKNQQSQTEYHTSNQDTKKARSWVISKNNWESKRKHNKKESLTSWLSR